MTSDVIELAWLAGFFDGEGCVTARFGKKGFESRLIVANTHMPSISKVYTLTGVGTIYCVPASTKTARGTAWWRVSGHHSELVAEALILYSITKREQLELFLAARLAVKKKEPKELIAYIVSEIKRVKWAEHQWSHRAISVPSDPLDTRP